MIRLETLIELRLLDSSLSSATFRLFDSMLEFALLPKSDEGVPRQAIQGNVVSVSSALRPSYERTAPVDDATLGRAARPRGPEVSPVTFYTGELLSWQFTALAKKYLEF